MQHLSKAGGPALVLAVDGVRIGQSEFIRDIEDLSCADFGTSLRIVIAVDDSVAERLVLNSTGRNASAIGRRGTRVSIGRLNDEEFSEATRIIQTGRAEIMKGGEFSFEFRVPWVLRAVMSEIVSKPQYGDPKLSALIPPFLGLDLLDHARAHVNDDEQRRRIRGIAAAVIDDAQDASRPISLVLHSIATFVLRRETLRQHLEHAEIEALIEQGYVKTIFLDSATPALVVRTPELLAIEAAAVLAVDLVQRAQDDSVRAAEWLCATAASIPLGDIVAAQALIDASKITNKFPMDLIRGLINSPPKQQSVSPGTKMTLHWPSRGLINLTFLEGGAMEAEAGGHRMVLPPEPGEEEHTAYSDIYGWLILSHLAGQTLLVEYEETRHARVDPGILLLVGTCPLVLCLPDSDTMLRRIRIHDVPDHGSIICHRSGIVEPITLSIFNFLSTEGENAESWVQEVARQRSLPLLMRTDIALRQLTELADTEIAKFARHMREDVIRPGTNDFPPVH